MDLFQDIPAASRSVTEFMMQWGATLPVWTRDIILDRMARPSPVDNLVGTLEALYAAPRDDLDPSAMVLTARLAEFCTRYGWQDLDQDGRGMGIMQAMRRDAGEQPIEGSTWPEKDSDPAALADYSEPAAIPAGGFNTMRTIEQDAQSLGEMVDDLVVKTSDGTPEVQETVTTFHDLLTAAIADPSTVDQDAANAIGESLRGVETELVSGDPVVYATVEQLHQMLSQVMVDHFPDLDWYAAAGVSDEARGDGAEQPLSGTKHPPAPTGT